MFVAIGTMQAGETFRTAITNRPGLTLEKPTRQGALVQLLDPPEEKTLSPHVLVRPVEEPEES